MVRSEVHALQSGDKFAYTEGGELMTVVDWVIDYYGDKIILYYQNGHLLGHPSDHTVVWLAL